MKILLSFGVAFVGLLLLTLAPNKTGGATLGAIIMIVGGTAVTVYFAKRGY